MQAATPAEPTIDALLARIAELEAMVVRLEATVREQGAMIASEATEIERLRAGRPSGKTPHNSSVLPASVVPPNRPAARTSGKTGARRGHQGHGRRRCQPDRVIERRPERCTGCGDKLSGVAGHVRGRSQQVELVLQAKEIDTAYPVLREVAE